MWCVPPRVLVPVVLTALLLAATPSGQAQGAPEPALSLAVEDPEDALIPGDAVHVRTVQVTLDCAPPASPLPLEVDLGLDPVPAWANATVEPAIVRFETCPPGQTVDHEVKVQIRLTSDAPGGATLDMVLRATTDSTTEQVDWKERVALILASTALLDEPRYKSGPNSQITIPVTVRNDGNHDIYVTFKVAENSSAQLNVAPPGQQVVPGGEVGTFPVDLQTPFKNGYMEREDRLSILVVRTSAYNESLVESDTLTATIETVGSYVPGPAPLLPILALLGLLARSRHGTGSKR